MAVTSRDVAREAGVSQPTVSRALGGDPRISERTRALVVAAAERLGYFPNTAARTLITRRTLSVGVVVGDVSNPFFAEQLNSLYYALKRAGYRLVLFQEGTDHKEAGEDVVPFLLGNALDGAIFTTGGLTSSIPKVLAEKGLPVVLLNRYVEGIAADRIIADNRGGGRLAARHLADLGHRRIATISGPPSTSTSRDRQQGFDAGLAESGLSVPPRLRKTGLYSLDSGYEACLELLDDPSPPTAIFCGNDVVAVGALNAAAAAGAEVPNYLSILGFDDLQISSWERVQLSTVHVPLARMAETAARMLVERVELSFSGGPRLKTLPTHLVPRATTAPPRHDV